MVVEMEVGDMLQKMRENTTERATKHGWEISCNRGLWSVTATNKEDVVREAMRYFIQYWGDGEYNTLAKDRGE